MFQKYRSCKYDVNLTSISWLCLLTCQILVSNQIYVEVKRADMICLSLLGFFGGRWLGANSPTVKLNINTFSKIPQPPVRNTYALSILDEHIFLCFSGICVYCRQHSEEPKFFLSTSVFLKNKQKKNQFKDVTERANLENNFLLRDEACFQLVLSDIMKFFSVYL